MNANLHERAVRMISAEFIEGLTAQDRSWLDRHLSACPDCSRRAQALRESIASLRSTSVDVNPWLVAATRRRVRSRAAAIQKHKSRLSAVWVGVALSMVWMVFTGPLTWRAFEWMGRSLGWGNGVWQSLFFLAWFLPATAAALALVWQRRTGSQQLP